MGNCKAQKEPSPYWLSLGGPFFLLLLALFLFARPLLLLGDGGTCRHFLTGIYVLEHHALPISTYMSAVEPNSVWMTHELLCDLLFGLPFNWLGLNWVVLTSAIAISLALVWSYQMARLRGSGLLLALPGLLLVLEACSLHWSARPHVFTYILFLACYYECFVSRRSFLHQSVTLSAIMLVWANTHGSFPLGLAMIFCRAVSDTTTRILAGNRFKTSTTQNGGVAGEDEGKGESEGGSADEIKEWSGKESIIVTTSALIASCLNVRGPGFINYVITYLTSPKIQAQSDEWRSIDFSLGAPVWCFMALAALLVTFWVYARFRPRISEYLYMVALFAASLYAMRLIPYFALAALPAMAAQAKFLPLQDRLRQIPAISNLLESDRRAGLSERTLLKLSIRCAFIGLSFALSLAFLLIPSIKITDFDPARLPVHALARMNEGGIKGLGFTRDNWGSYLYWRLNEKIFIDDKTDFYSQKLLDDYVAILQTLPRWQTCLTKYQFKFVLIPRGLPLEFMLDASPGWKKSYEDRTAVLFTKQ